jgi:hypothetical protein
VSATREVRKAKFLSLARRGKAMEKAWDRATQLGDVKKLEVLTDRAPSFYKAWEKYEAEGFRIVFTNGSLVVYDELPEA